jgi:hypothetical protein
MRPLTDREQEVFRKDFQDKEREIQRYIGVYLSGLVLVTGWIIGPQSRPLVAMALGNRGYNVYAFLIFVALNILFTNFLIYKSIIIHEINQFIAYLSKPESAFLYWESWRRSPQSATRRVRTVYTVLLAVLPISVSFLIMFGLWQLLHSDPRSLVEQYNAVEAPAAVAAVNLGGNEPGSDRSTVTAGVAQNKAGSQLLPEQISSVFATAWIWYLIVAFLHAIPFWFIYENVFPTKWRWDKINMYRAPDTSSFKTLKSNLFDARDADQHPARVTAKRIKLFDKATGEFLAEITLGQLRFLIDNLEEEYEGDQDYHIQRETVDVLESRGADGELLNTLRNAVEPKGEIEIRWAKE